MNSVGLYFFYDVRLIYTLDMNGVRVSHIFSVARWPSSPVERLFDGVNGISAYTSALNGGFVGTEAQWIATLKVCQGIQGSTLTVKKFIFAPADFVDGHKLYYFRC
jgi:hypothetical protein